MFHDLVVELELEWLNLSHIVEIYFTTATCSAIKLQKK